MKGLTDMEKRIIEQKAQKVIDEQIKDLKAPIDVISLAKEMGFVVANAMLTDNTDGFIIVNEDDDNVMQMNTSKLIGVNSSRSLDTKRFIIAHEIGHYIFEENNKIFARRENKHGRSEVENDLDYFSACLLMPAELFRKEFLELSSKDKDMSSEDKAIFLSAKFIVPLISVKRRLNELKL